MLKKVNCFSYAPLFIIDRRARDAKDGKGNLKFSKIVP